MNAKTTLTQDLAECKAIAEKLNRLAIEREAIKKRLADAQAALERLRRSQK